MTDVLKYSAFTRDGAGGNPAGVVLEADHLTDAQMQRIAADLGYSESAFLVAPPTGDEPTTTRYFAPQGEVAFCGHATIAAAAALADLGRSGTYVLDTRAGAVRVEATSGPDGARGALESPLTGYRSLPEEQARELLNLLGWSPADLHPEHPVGIGTAGNLHPVLVAADAARLDTLDYDFEGLQRLCRQQDWVTLQLITPSGQSRWRSRNPFPYGGVVEDPATGSAAAAFSGYLRHHGALATGESITIDQGVEMGAPSRLHVTALTDRARVEGSAVQLS